jgi:hypothetical protein
MKMRHLLAGLGLAVCVASAAPAAAQETPADTAAVLIDVARVLEQERAWETLEELLLFIVRHYPGTPAATDAEDWLAELRRTRTATEGRTRFIVFQTLFGAWLGVAVPAAFGAEDPEPFGLGLLLGGPTGFFWSSVYARNNPMSKGQAGVINFAEMWGTWQGVGWQQVLDIGDDCTEFGCITSETAPFAAALVGGLAGLGTGLVITRLTDIPESHIELVNHAALWGTWYGLAGGILAEAEDDALLTWTLIGGDVALVAGIPLARSWNPSPGRVRLVSIAGLAGLLGGFGLDLLLSVDDDQTAVLLPTLGATVGLAAGVVVTAPGEPSRSEASRGTLHGSLLNWDRGLELDFPMPRPATVQVIDRQGAIRTRPAAQFTLLSARF